MSVMLSCAVRHGVEKALSMSQPTPACIFNLGRRGARKRLIFGLAFLAIGGVGGGLLWFYDLSAWWWLTLFLPLWLGLLGLLEARTRT
jgi:hypothetical protein